MIELPHDFPHTAPEGYKYELEQFKTKMVRIWLCHPDVYVYTSKPVRTVWGFFDQRKKVYHAPVNFKKPGKMVDIDKTTHHTAMQVQHPPAETPLKSSVSILNYL